MGNRINFHQKPSLLRQQQMWINDFTPVFKSLFFKPGKSRHFHVFSAIIQNMIIWSWQLSRNRLEYKSYTRYLKQLPFITLSTTCRPQTHKKNWVTIRVTALPFPPADSPSEPKIRTVLAHYSLSDLKRRKKKRPDVPWHTQHCGNPYRVRMQIIRMPAFGWLCIMLQAIGN